MHLKCIVYKYFKVAQSYVQKALYLHFDTFQCSHLQYTVTYYIQHGVMILGYIYTIGIAVCFSKVKVPLY